jgi:PAS domain S-box-containing protein
MPALKQNRQGKARPSPREENRFLALAQESADVFWLLTPEGQMDEYTQSWQAFTGQKARECLGQGWRDALHPAERSEIDEALTQAVTTRHTSEMTCQVRSTNGAYRSLALRIIPVFLPHHDNVQELVICGKDVTRRRLQARMSQAQVQLALKASQVGMWDWDVVADQWTCTEQTNALFGWPANRPVTYQNFLAAIHPDDRRRLAHLMSRALRGEEEYRTEYRVIWPDGSIHWLADRARSIFNSRGQATHMIGATIDITDLKMAEAQAREAEMRNHMILASITDAFICLDAGWRYTCVNQRMEEYAGKRREELLGKSIWDIFPQLRGTPFERMCRRVVASQKSEHKEIYLTPFHLWVDLRVYPAEDGLAIYATDVSERKRVEEALCESEARFRHFVNSNIIGITISDLNGHIYEANEAFLGLVGYTRADVAEGKLNWTLLTPPEDMAREARIEEEMRASGAFQPFEKEYLTRDGRRVPVLVGGTLFRPGSSAAEGSQPLQISFVLDLRARKAVEQQKDLFLSMASHELKTPLAALKGTLQLLERRMKRVRTTAGVLPADQQAFLEDLARHLNNSVRQVDLQTRLINDLLDISRIRANTLELTLRTCDLAQIVRETVADLRVAEPERALELRLPESPVPVLVDMQRIHQVITNYITNAVRYSSAEKPIRVGLDLEGEHARVWVQDEGQGLSAEACQKIWEPFQKAQNAAAQSTGGKGLGLGLYICRMLIALHHGAVGVESVPDQGSLFWFTLPLHSE